MPSRPTTLRPQSNPTKRNKEAIKANNTEIKTRPFALPKDASRSIGHPARNECRQEKPGAPDLPVHLPQTTRSADDAPSPPVIPEAAAQRRLSGTLATPAHAKIRLRAWARLHARSGRDDGWRG